MWQLLCLLLLLAGTLAMEPIREGIKQLEQAWESLSLSG